MIETAILDLYLQGLTRRKVARLLVDHLARPQQDPKRQLRLATRRLKNMERARWFRDALWERAMIAADLRTPQILKGVVRKAEEGKVDAAKLALSITGRHTEQGDVQATQVNIVFGGDLARPGRHQEMKAIEGQRAAEDSEIEDGEWTES
jgi:hypothetical protein